MPAEGAPRFVVLGCGSIGQRHLRNLLALQAGVVIAYDPVPERRAEAAALGVDVVADLEAVWERRPLAALIAASTQTHVPLALQAVRAGCHVFIEKPLAHTLAGLEPLLAEVAQRGLVTMVGCNMRFHPGPAAVKRLIEAGEVGDILAARIQTGSYLPRWRPQQDYRQSYSASPDWGGAVLDCIHELDLALWYLGPAELVAAVSLPARTIGLQTDGLAEITLAHETGAISNVHLNFVQRDYRRTCQIIGSQGTIYWDFGDRHVRVFGPAGELSANHPEPEGWGLNQMYVDELAHFLEAVATRAPTINPIAEGARTLALALAARQAGPGRRTIPKETECL